MLIDDVDSASSTLKPGIGSNYNSPTLPATSNFSAPESGATNTADATTLAFGPISASQGKLAEGAPHVPSRSSSNAKTNALSLNPIPEKTTTDPISTSRRGSKGSIKPKSRGGSVASSRHSKKEKAKLAPAAEQEKLVEDQSAVTTRPKKRGFLSKILSCCSAPENANAVELGDQAVPAKKAKVLQQKPGRQPTPLVKPNASAGESTTGDPKEITEENIGGPEYSEMKSSSKPTMMARSSREKLTTEKVGPPIAAVEPEETQESPAPVAYRDPPLPPVPSSTVPSTQEMKEEHGIPTQAAGIAAPPQLIEPDQSVAEQGTTINDRTPQQESRDTDIAMVDAPPPTSTADAPSVTTRELQQAQINLPPPPPRNGNGNGNGNGAASSSNAIAPSDKQRWLLPPLQPDFKGRKCLVLDLDETLVHSSFKVRELTIVMISG